MPSKTSLLFFTTPGRYFFVKESFEDPSLLTPRFPWRCRRERQKKKGDRKGDPPPSKPYKEQEIKSFPIFPQPSLIFFDVTRWRHPFGKGCLKRKCIAFEVFLPFFTVLPNIVQNFRNVFKNMIFSIQNFQTKILGILNLFFKTVQHKFENPQVSSLRFKSKAQVNIREFPRISKYCT